MAKKKKTNYMQLNTRKSKKIYANKIKILKFKNAKNKNVIK